VLLTRLRDSSPLTSLNHLMHGMNLHGYIYIHTYSLDALPSAACRFSSKRMYWRQSHGGLNDVCVELLMHQWRHFGVIIVGCTRLRPSFVAFAPSRRKQFSLSDSHRNSITITQPSKTYNIPLPFAKCLTLLATIRLDFVKPNNS
jgi:hypothetical protein